ncbi:MAG TPA: hypothetical protein VFS51_11375, partial [Gemmatimonadales bacterium]|nr:hypothetical protein [Gemmatimonadales bacterium]
MHSFLELTVMIYQELVGRPAHGRHDRTTPVLDERLRGRILVAVADSPNGGLWPRLPGGKRVDILRRVLRDNPDLMMQATEAYELDHAIEKLAKVVVEKNERRVAKPLKKHGVDPTNPDQVADGLRRDRGLLSEVAQKGTVAIPYPIVLALELEEIRK